jgi:hypothetical protein
VTSAGFLSMTFSCGFYCPSIPASGTFTDWWLGWDSNPRSATYEDAEMAASLPSYNLEQNQSEAVSISVRGRQPCNTFWIELQSRFSCSANTLRCPYPKISKNFPQNGGRVGPHHEEGSEREPTLRRRLSFYSLPGPTPDSPHR